MRAMWQTLISLATPRRAKYLARYRVGVGGWGWERVPQGPYSFLINGGRCSTPRLLCIRCILGVTLWGPPPPHTFTHIHSPGEDGTAIIGPLRTGKALRYASEGSRRWQQPIPLHRRKYIYIYKKIPQFQQTEGLAFPAHADGGWGGGVRQRYAGGKGGGSIAGTGGGGLVSLLSQHVRKVQSGQFNSKPMRQANFPARSSAAASEERLTLTVVITVTPATTWGEEEGRRGERECVDRTLSKGATVTPPPAMSAGKKKEKERNL